MEWLSTISEGLLYLDWLDLSLQYFIAYVKWVERKNIVIDEIHKQ